MAAVSIRRLLATVVLCSSCGGGPTPGPVARSTAWRTHRLPVGLAIDLPAVAAVERASWPGGGGAILALVFDADETLRVALRAGAGEGLDAFRRDHAGWTIEPAVRGRVCGRPAWIARATRPAEEIECVITTDGNAPGWRAASEAVAVVVEGGAVPARLTVELESDRPGRASAWRDRVLRSLRCSR